MGRETRARAAAPDVEFIRCDDAGFVETICVKSEQLVSTFGAPEVIRLSPFNKDEFGIDASNARSREIDGYDPRKPARGEVSDLRQERASAPSPDRLSPAQRHPDPHRR